jgi:hypothetical protein
MSQEEGPVRQRIVQLAVVTRLVCRLRWGRSREGKRGSRIGRLSCSQGAGSRENGAAAFAGKGTERALLRARAKLTCGNPRRNFARDATAIPFCPPTSTREETMALCRYQAAYMPESWAAQLKNPQNRAETVGCVACGRRGKAYRRMVLFR